MRMPGLAFDASPPFQMMTPRTCSSSSMMTLLMSASTISERMVGRRGNTVLDQRVITLAGTSKTVTLPGLVQQAHGHRRGHFAKVNISQP